MVESFIYPGMLQGQDILWLFYDANLAVVAFSAEADRAGVGLGDVEAGGAQGDFLFQRQDGFGQEFGLLVRGTQKIVSNSLRTLWPNTGQLVKLLDELIDSFGSRYNTLALYWLSLILLHKSRDFKTAGQSTELLGGSFLRLGNSFTYSSQDQVFEELHIIGIDYLR